MADFPILFTGKDVSFEPRSTGQLERAGKRFDERFIEGAKFKRQEKMRDEKFFFDNADVDPVSLMSNKLTELQEGAMNMYNEKWAGVYSKQGGALTSAQKSEMFRDRKALEAKQQKWLASQQMYERDYELIKRDSTRASRILDDDTFREAQDNYFKTGEYTGGLKYTSINPYDYFDKKSRSWKGEGAFSSDVESEVGGKKVYTKVGQNASIEAAMDEVERDAMQGGPNGRLLQGVVDEFLKLPDEVKDKFLPAFDGTADTREEKNGIIQWAREEFAPRLRYVNEATREREATSGSSAANKTYTYSDKKLIDKSGNEVLRFTTDDKGNLVGKGRGLKSIKLNVTPNNLLSKTGKSLEKELGGEIQNDMISVTPVSIGGTVVLRTNAPITVKKIGPSAPSSVGDNYEVLEDGNDMWEEKIPTGTVVGTRIGNVSSELATYLGGEVFEQALSDNIPPSKEATPQEGLGFLKKVKDFFTSPGTTKAPEKDKPAVEKMDVNKILQDNKSKNFVKRILDPTTVKPLDRGKGVSSTHSMAWGEADGKYYVYPTVVENNGKLVDISDKDPLGYALKNNEYIVFDTAEEAERFSSDAGYKQAWAKDKEEEIDFDQFKRK